MCQWSRQSRNWFVWERQSPLEMVDGLLDTLTVNFRRHTVYSHHAFACTSIELLGATNAKPVFFEYQCRLPLIAVMEEATSEVTE